MAILNRLPMKDRLRSWGMEIDSRSNLCHNEYETRDHVYFECVYTKEVWQKILQPCKIDRRVGSWYTELSWSENRLKGKALISTLLRIAWNACIYFIWGERNQRIFKQGEMTTAQMVDKVKEIVRYRLHGLKHIAGDMNSYIVADSC
ncbi:uncharacterized protein LOC111288994 [Durio zibethinus]|uniref:Uncharacterized protein LOC111288994 n=1 Tax=Durio zibethinus TaxID=66656 RepID=A0A6P5Y6K8_DURZI|nr:uncharacterized protein LOC111288994 [Durio zibethinus]